jgi:hypothetical protein
MREESKKEIFIKLKEITEMQKIMKI